MPSNPKVYINGRFLSQKATGVQKYALGLCRALHTLNIHYQIITPSDGKHAHDLNIARTAFRGGFFWEQFVLPLYMWFHKGGLLINLCNTAPLLYKNQFVTIHDLAFLKDKNWFNPLFKRWYSFLIPRLCKRARAVITVSECIKNEIITTYNIPPVQINLIFNSIPEMDYAPQRPFKFKYIFLTGVYNPRKNCSFVIKLLGDLKKMNYHIVAVGDDAGIYKKLHFQDDPYLHIFRYTDDRFYYTLMKHAEALIYPSEYEGFGIPVLEAIALGVPVLLPDRAMYKDIFEDFPFYYKQDDTDSFLSKLNKINIYKAVVKDINILKNKYNFTASANLLIDLIEQHIK